MSINIQTVNGLKVLADKTTKDTIKAALGYNPANEESLSSHENDDVKHITAAERESWRNKPETYEQLKEKPDIFDDDSGEFYITDGSGNIIAKIDDNGIHALNVFVGASDKEVSSKEDLTELSRTINNNILAINDDISVINSNFTSTTANLNKNIVTLFNDKSDIDHSHTDLDSESEDFTITDEDGNIAVRVDSTGLYTSQVFVGLDQKEVALQEDLSSHSHEQIKFGSSSSVVTDDNGVKIKGVEVKIRDNSQHDLLTADYQGGVIIPKLTVTESATISNGIDITTEKLKATGNTHLVGTTKINNGLRVNGGCGFYSYSTNESSAIPIYAIVDDEPIATENGLYLAKKDDQRGWLSVKKLHTGGATFKVIQYFSDGVNTWSREFLIGDTNDTPGAWLPVSGYQKGDATCTGLSASTINVSLTKHGATAFLTVSGEVEDNVQITIPEGFRPKKDMQFMVHYLRYNEKDVWGGILTITKNGIGTIETPTAWLNYSLYIQNISWEIA